MKNTTKKSPFNINGIIATVTVAMVSNNHTSLSNFLTLQ